MFSYLSYMLLTVGYYSSNLFKMRLVEKARSAFDELRTVVLVGSQGIDKLDRSTTSVPQLWQFTCRCKGTGFKWQQGSAQTQIMTVIILQYFAMIIPHPWLCPQSFSHKNMPNPHDLQDGRGCSNPQRSGYMGWIQFYFLPDLVPQLTQGHPWSNDTHIPVGSRCCGLHSSH